jgi:hypothetical protein
MHCSHLCFTTSFLSPQTPRVGFAEFWYRMVFCETELRFLLLEKEGEFYTEEPSLGGKPPNPQGRLRRVLGIECLLRSRTTLFASFSGKRRRVLHRRTVSWGQAPKPPGSASPSFGYRMSSAKQNKRFLLLFLEKEGYFYSEEQLLGGSSRLGRVLYRVIFCEAEQTLFASFSGKRRIFLLRRTISWGIGSASQSFGYRMVFCEAELWFLFLF